MEYRIEYAGGRCRNFAHSRKDLLTWLKILKDEEITDIRKMYKNGFTETVMEKYEKYIVATLGCHTFRKNSMRSFADYPCSEIS